MKSYLSLLFKSISLFFLVILNSCAGEPDFAVDSIASGISGSSTVVVEEGIDAIVFEGRDLFTNRSCNVSLALFEENGSHTWIASVNYVLHGERLPDIALGEYRFDINTNTYHSISEVDEGSPVLVGGLLRDGDAFEIEKMQDYIANFELAYSLQLDLSPSINLSSFEEAMEEVIADPTRLESFNAELNQINRIVFRLYHSGHYDAGGCAITKAISVTAKNFELEVSESGDHDHDHNH